MPTLHYAIKAGGSIDGVPVPIGNYTGSLPISSAEETAVNLGLQAGLATGLATPDGHGGDEIHFSGTAPVVKIFGFLQLHPGYSVDADIWITD